MTLQPTPPADFNELLLKLYGLSQEQPMHSFQDAALRLIKPLLPFAAAVWGTASTTPTGIDIHSLHLHNKTQDMVAAYEEVKHLDSAAVSMFSPAKVTRAFHTDSFFAAREKHPIRDFMARFEQPNFLVTTDCNARTSLMHWLTFYRANRDAYCTPADAERLHQLAPHLMQALAFNRTAHLGRLAAAVCELSPHGVAIADVKGVLYASNAQFATAMRAACGVDGAVGNLLPYSLLAQIAPRGNQFHWQQLVLTCHAEHGLIFIKTRELQAVDLLTEREHTIAKLVAQGHTHKEVAHMLSRSPATVRNQIAQIYGKLNINCVAELVNALNLQ